MKTITLPGLGLPLHSIFCIGRNYADHIEELKNAVPDEPVVFTKPLSSVIFSGEEIRLPKTSSEVHHEAEVVLALGAELQHCDEEQARKAISGLAIGIDLTARDIQARLKAKGLPWDKAKGQDTFTVLGNFIPYEDQDLSDLPFSLSVNGQTRQSGNTKLMLNTIPKLICHLSEYFTLHPGDLIFTGTPKGVAALNHGDLVSASLHSIASSLECPVVSE